MTIESTDETKRKVLQWLQGENIELKHDELVEDVKGLPGSDDVIHAMAQAHIRANDRIKSIRLTHGEEAYEQAESVVAHTLADANRAVVEHILGGNPDAKKASDMEDFTERLCEKLIELWEK